MKHMLKNAHFCFYQTFVVQSSNPNCPPLSRPLCLSQTFYIALQFSQQVLNDLKLSLVRPSDRRHLNTMQTIFPLLLASTLETLKSVEYNYSTLRAHQR